MDEDLRRLERQAATGDLAARSALLAARRRVDGGTERALKALFATYWTPRGWRSDRSTPPDELAHAKRVGIMFDPVSLDHDAQVEWARRSAAALAPGTVADAFLASLTARRLEWRSALGSYALARELPAHPLEAEAGSTTCRACGAYARNDDADLNVLQFERYKWGGVRHDEPLYAGFDLEQLLLDEPPRPTPEDVTLLRAILVAARGLPPKARPADLEKAIAPHLGGNMNERRALLSILGLAGVLRPADGWRPGFVPMVERQEGTGDLPWPIALWRGSDGVDDTAVARWFGHALNGGAARPPSAKRGRSRPPAARRPRPTRSATRRRPSRGS